MEMCTRFGGLVTFALALLAPAVARAQTDAEPAPPRTVAAVEEAPTDHQGVVGHWGVTYFDITDLPIAAIPTFTGTTVTGLSQNNVPAPVVGVRYWLNRRIGIDGGLGLGMTDGSDETVAGGTDTTTNKTSTTGVAFHAGLPVALGWGKHYTFLVVPNTTLGFTTASYTPPGSTNNISLSGFLWDIGARIGAEIHFGFIGIPQLALQASVGLSFRRTVYKASIGGNSASDGTNAFGTNVQANPWSIFNDTISATYYF